MRSSFALLAACSALIVAGFGGETSVTASGQQKTAPPFSFTNVGAEAGLAGLTVFGGRETNRYLLETTGSGVAMFDYDADGLQDLFVVPLTKKRSCRPSAS